MEHFPGCLNNLPHWFLRQETQVTRLRRERERRRRGRKRGEVRERSRGRQKGRNRWRVIEKRESESEERGMEKEPCVLIWYSSVCASVHSYDIQAAEMWLSSRSSSNLLPMCDRKKQLASRGPAERSGGEQRGNRLLPSCHRRRLGDPEDWVATHGPAAAHHSQHPSPLSPLLVL